MKKWLFLFLLPFSICFSWSFIDSNSGLRLDIPEIFSFSEKDHSDDLWWYEFKDENGNSLIIEVEKYDQNKSHCEHFHRSLTKGTDEKEQMICEGLEFKHFRIGQLEISKCQLRILAIAEMYRKPLCFCDYLFVKDQFGFTISLTTEEGNLDNDALMQPLLESISFLQ